MNQTKISKYLSLIAIIFYLNIASGSALAAAEAAKALASAEAAKKIASDQAIGSAILNSLSAKPCGAPITPLIQLNSVPFSPVVVNKNPLNPQQQLIFSSKYETMLKLIKNYLDSIGHTSNFYHEMVQRLQEMKTRCDLEKSTFGNEFSKRDYDDALLILNSAVIASIPSPSLTTFNQEVVGAFSSALTKLRAKTPEHVIKGIDDLIASITAYSTYYVVPLPSRL